MAGDTYPSYRRRENQASFSKGTARMDNRDVVLFNPYLAKRFDAHINVEVTSSIRPVKYMFKYTFKGHDRANVELGSAPDEIQAHLDARYVGASEAAWRLFEFERHGSAHTVTRMAAHLPLENLIHFRAGEDAAAARNPASQRATLTAWFAFNAAQPLDAPMSITFKDVLYHDMPL